MKRTLNILLILLVLDLFGIGALWYGYTSTTDIKANETELMDKLQQEGMKGKKLNELRQTLASVGKQRGELEKFLLDPSDENQIPLLNSFEQLGASTTGLAVDISRFDFVDSPAKAIHAGATLSGSWAQLYYFLRLIEEYPSRIVIDKFDAHIDTPAGSTLGKITQDHWMGNISFAIVGLKQK